MKKWIHCSKNLSDYAADSRFNNYQLRVIKEGLDEGIDVSTYADPKFDEGQMFEILLGLEENVDISWYADPKFNTWQMNEIRTGLRHGVDVSSYADPKFSAEDMDLIRRSDDVYKSYDRDDSGEQSSTYSSDEWIDWTSYEDDEEFGPLSEKFEEIFDMYLSDPEDEVNTELKIFPEPSVQGNFGSVFILDESGKNRWSSYDAEVDWRDWCEREFDMAKAANNAEEYKQMYREWMKEILTI